MKPATKYILTIILLAIPFALIAYSYRMPNPYRLSGKHFLVFYIAQILAVCLSLWILLLKKQPATAQQQYVKTEVADKQHPSPNTFAKSICILSFLMGFIRLLQGVSHHKPVGFLILLLCFNLIIYSILWRPQGKQ